MDPLSLKLVLARYGTVILSMYLVACVARGTISAVSLLFIVFAAVLSLKYLLFDAAARSIRRRKPDLKIVPWLWIGYVLAVLVDVSATWLSVRVETSLALGAATVFITPWILVAALLGMVVHTLVARKSRKQGAK